MIVEAHAKVNWSLFITGRRTDGYHLVDMILQKTELCDELEFLPADTLSLRIDKNSEYTAPADGSNLILRAAEALKKHTSASKGARITLKKKIPSGAGLGGGSADAAAALLALNRMWNLGLSVRELEEIALPLGADIPFCLHRETMRVTGIGETLSPLPALPRRHLIILKGPEGLDTGSVYRRWDLEEEKRSYSHIRALSALTDPEGDLAGALVNVLEGPARALCPRIGADLARLTAAGAFFAQMTGSGSAVYGVFRDRTGAEKAYRSLKGDGSGGTCILTAAI